LRFFTFSFVFLFVLCEEGGVGWRGREGWVGGGGREGGTEEEGVGRLTHHTHSSSEKLVLPLLPLSSAFPSVDHGIEDKRLRVPLLFSLRPLRTHVPAFKRPPVNGLRMEGRASRLLLPLVAKPTIMHKCHTLTLTSPPYNLSTGPA